MSTSEQISFRRKTIAVVVGLCFTLSIACGFVIHLYVHRIGKEIVNAWVETEALSIQEGNFVVGIARFSRALFSSSVVTSINIVQIRDNDFVIVSSYGENSESIPICQIPEFDTITTCFKGIFHEIIVYRSIYRDDLIAVFELKPTMAIFIYAGLASALCLISVGFLLGMRQIVKTENRRRMILVKMAINDLVFGSAPSHDLASELPEVADDWRDLAVHVNKMKDSLERSARDSAVGRLTAHLSHDLQAPLHSFENLLILPAGVPIDDYKQSIRISLFRLNSMISALRNSDVDQLISPKLCRLNFSNGLVELRAKALQKNIALNAPKFNDILVKIDEQKFERAWINLVSNALDFAKKEVLIQVKVVNSDVYILIMDDGPGVDTEIASKLFQRGATFGKTDGTGLGLAFVRQIMRGHGGDVTYRRENSRTIFECHLPCAIVNDEEENTEVAFEMPKFDENSKPKVVSICLEPIALSAEILLYLNSQNSKKFIFIGEYSKGKTDIVVANNREVVLPLFEDEVEIMDYPPHLSADALKLRILRRFLT